MSKKTRMRPPKPPGDAEHRTGISAGAPEWLNADVLRQQLGTDTARRTLQRRLAYLVGKGRIPNGPRDATAVSTPVARKRKRTTAT